VVCEKSAAGDFIETGDAGRGFNCFRGAQDGL
jgi:hypothetical protein